MDITASQIRINLGARNVIRHSSVFHVGTLDACDREALSYEGDGLSVSLHPQDWITIARLGGSVWELRAEGGESMSFLDLHSLSCDQRRAVIDWGLEQGWVETVTRWQIPDFDEDDNIVGSFSFESFSEAAGELEDSEREDVLPVLVEQLVATSTFPVGRMDGSDPVDGLLATYVQRFTDLEGLWWNDDHDLQRYSCPRGVLLRGVNELSCSSV